MGQKGMSAPSKIPASSNRKKTIKHKKHAIVFGAVRDSKFKDPNLATAEVLALIETSGEKDDWFIHVAIAPRAARTTGLNVASLHPLVQIPHKLAKKENGSPCGEPFSFLGDLRELHP